VMSRRCRRGAGPRRRTARLDRYRAGRSRSLHALGGEVRTTTT
jgi:hypothetical protein